MVGLYDGTPATGQRADVRLVCPSMGRCVCAFPPDFQIDDVDPLSLRYQLVFSGFAGPFENYPSTAILLGGDAAGRLKIGPNSFLGTSLKAHGLRLRLEPTALRPVRIRLNGSHFQWGLEFWQSRANVTAPSKWTRVIAGVDYLLTTSLNGFGAGAATFQVDRRGFVSLFNVSVPATVRPDSPNTIDFTPP